MSKYGLSKEQIEESRRKYGDNTLTQPPRETFWSKLLGNFQDPIIRILIVALLVNAFFVYLGHGDWIETIGIFLAIILATFVSTWSEYSNENAFQKLQEEASRIRCKVWRDGEPQEIAIDDVVVGAVDLRVGGKDYRLLACIREVLCDKRLPVNGIKSCKRSINNYRQLFLGAYRQRPEH